MRDALLTNRRQLGIIAGAVLGLALIAILLLPDSLPLHTPGAMLPGHESLECRECHIKAPGTLRQQLQAQLQHLLGNRATPASIGHLPVSNDDCLACHRRANDNHPVFRFFEPRYQEVRATLAPHQCSSCHLEHQGKSITSSADYCRHCHGRLEIRNDPIDTPHKQLVEQKRWGSCLGCHDYHGNHQRKAQLKLSKMIDPANIEHYFQGGRSPYGEQRHYQAKESRYHAAD